MCVRVCVAGIPFLVEYFFACTGLRLEEHKPSHDTHKPPQHQLHTGGLDMFRLHLLPRYQIKPIKRLVHRRNHRQHATGHKATKQTMAFLKYCKQHAE